MVVKIHEFGERCSTGITVVTPSVRSTRAVVLGRLVPKEGLWSKQQSTCWTHLSASLLVNQFSMHIQLELVPERLSTAIAYVLPDLVVDDLDMLFQAPIIDECLVTLVTLDPVLA